MTTAELDVNLLTILNDDCIYQILERLSLEDICICSRTCKRLQVLCENHFRRKYPNEANTEVTIGILNEKLLIKPSKYYFKYFHNFVTKLTIIGANFEKEPEYMELFVYFVKTKCDPNLHKICIAGDIKLNETFCKQIEDVLRNVEHVEFANRKEKGEGETIFLSYCPNASKLILRELIPIENVSAILEQKYLKVTDFCYVFVGVYDLIAEKFQTFFQTNDQIRFVAWKFEFCRKTHVIQLVDTLRYALNLEHLFFSLWKSFYKDQFNNSSYSMLFSCFNDLCNRVNFKTLELEFVFPEGADAFKSHVNHLANWKQLTKIHFTNMRLTDVIPTSRSLVQLRIVHFHSLLEEDDWNQRTNLDELALHQVEEIQMDLMWNDKIITAYVMQFVRHWTNLKRILLPYSHGFDTAFDIAELNRAREKLKNACDLTIFTDHAGNVTNLSHKLVKLKLVHFESVYGIPYHRYYMSSGQ